MAHSGSGRVTEPGGGGGYSACSTAVSVIVAGSGQLTPAARARARQSLTVAGDSFRLRAMARFDKAAVWCSRKISRVLRIDNLV